MGSDNFSSDEEIKKFYTLFCEIFTAFHNYATAKRLFQNNIFSWSLTSYYYSLMHCGRAICFMALNCFPKGHKDLYKLLTGTGINNRKFWKLENPRGVEESHNFWEIINGLPGTNNSDELRIKKLGKDLENVKHIREFNSYEMFIVAHQIEHSILSPELKKGTERIGEIVRNYLLFITDLLFRYVQGKSDEFKDFLLDRNQNYKWAFEHLTQSLEKQQFDDETIDEIDGIIKERLLDKISARGECPDDFYDKISFKLFGAKRGIINNFIESLKRLEENETHEIED